MSYNWNYNSGTSYTTGSTYNWNTGNSNTATCTPPWKPGYGPDSNSTSSSSSSGSRSNKKGSSSSSSSKGKKSKQSNKKKGSSGGGNSNTTSKAAQKDANFMQWLKYSYYNESPSSDADWKSGKTGENISDEQFEKYYTEYKQALAATKGKNKQDKIDNLLKAAKENGSNKGHVVTSEQKQTDAKNDESGTKENNQKRNSAGNTQSELERNPQYYVWDSNGNVTRVLTDKELEEFKKYIDDTSTYNGNFKLNDSETIVRKDSAGNFIILSKDEVEDVEKNLQDFIQNNQETWADAESAVEWGTSDTMSQAEATERSAIGFDIRTARFDGMMLQSDTGSSAVVPFASSTVASCFSDMVFTVSQSEIEKYDKAANNKLSNVQTLSNPDKVKSLNEQLTAKDQASQDAKNVQKSEENSGKHDIKNPGADPNYQKYRTIGDLHGVSSLMNPYAITRLYGSLGRINLVKGKSEAIMPKENRMYDIRDQRRFYDLNVDEATNERDFLSVTTPTTSNIIACCNKDNWGRTPYSFNDFVFCKYWNIIPNNRLITLRKYAAPCLDNLNFEGMGKKNENSQGWSEQPDESQENMFAPVATAVTYFGEETENSLSSLLTIGTGLPWGDLKASIWTVSGDQGSNESQVVDDQINSGLSGWSPLDNIAKDVQSFGKFVGLFEKGGFSASKDQGVVDKRYDNMVDPYTNGPYSNRILGPVNKISSIKQRAKSDGGEAEDLKFEHSLEVKFNYIARPIGGVNTKAAMLDILANLLEIGSASAVFWGGAHKFEIHPSSYPWGGAPGQKGIMHKLYQGKIFGEDGALHDLMKGILSLGKNGDGSFSWDNITNQLKGLFQGITGAVSQAINSIASSVGIAEDMVSKATAKAEELVAGASDDPEKAKKQQEEGKKKMNNLMNNTQEMLKARMIKATTMPTVQGMRSILIGSPVGNWHLTIGNPLNPIAVIGNLVCSNMKFKFSEEIGPDDFPVELECSFTLEHGMPRDKDAISSMFNRGAGKIYNLPDALRVTSDYETKVDQYTGTKHWRMGASYVSAASLMPGVAGKQYGNLNNTSKIPNSENATLFIPKFNPVIIPDSAAWEELKNGEYLAEINNRAVFKANLATRKQLI